MDLVELPHLKADSELQDHSITNIAYQESWLLVIASMLLLLFKTSAQIT